MSITKTMLKWLHQIDRAGAAPIVFLPGSGTAVYPVALRGMWTSMVGNLAGAGLITCTAVTHPNGKALRLTAAGKRAIQRHPLKDEVTA